MGTRAQSRKEKRKQKQSQKRRQKRKKEQQRQAKAQRQTRMLLTGSTRHQQRISKQRPEMWPGENPHDVAVYDDTALATLAPELAGQVTAIREAFQLACDFRGEEAIQRTSGIARSSPFSEWRLFIRGLTAWLADEYEKAGEAWGRLDAERRPARIAATMMNALREDVTNTSATHHQPESADTVANPWAEALDEQLLYHAKLLRRVRFERPAIKIAEIGVREPEEAEELTLGPRKIRWLKSFIAEHGELEPALTEALQQVALHRAFGQMYIDLFEDAARAFEGPRHDRRNLLLSFYYYASMPNEENAEQKRDRALRQYLEEDLPGNETLSKPLRAAIASQIHLEEARVEMRPAGPGPAFLFDDWEDPRIVRRHLNASVRAYPAHRAAHQAHFDWIEKALDGSSLTKAERAPLLKEQSRVMTAWSKALPDDIKPRLWLVDYLLENELMEQAKPHVDWLAGTRQDDPLARAAPWKWQLLEAMRMCRRKAWLREAPVRMEEAELLWPAWLSREWLPYLYAAITLRAGDEDAFQAQRQRMGHESGVKLDSVADACMMLGAAQHMRVSAARLKPLRAPVDRAVQNVGDLPMEELLAVSGFFWDLYRTGLRYPAYRKHGGKFAKELFARLSKRPDSWALSHLEDARVQTAMLLCAEHRCLEDGYDLNLPDWYAMSAVQQQPMFAAAKVHAVLNFNWGADEFADLVSPMREMAQSQSDAFYRHWFASRADELESLIEQQSSSRFGFNPFDLFYGKYNEESADGDDLGFDPNCDCAKCTAARRAYEAKQKQDPTRESTS